MSFTPMYVGETGIPLKSTLTDDSEVPINLTGYNPVMDFSLHMQNINNPATVKICTGPWTILDATNGIISYQWQAADVSMAGIWLMQFSAKNIIFDPQLLEIRPTF